MNIYLKNQLYNFLLNNRMYIATVKGEAITPVDPIIPEPEEPTVYSVIWNSDTNCFGTVNDRDILTTGGANSLPIEIPEGQQLRITAITIDDFIGELGVFYASSWSQVTISGKKYLPSNIPSSLEYWTFTHTETGGYIIIATSNPNLTGTAKHVSIQYVLEEELNKDNPDVPDIPEELDDEYDIAAKRLSTVLEPDVILEAACTAYSVSSGEDLLAKVLLGLNIAITLSSDIVIEDNNTTWSSDIIINGKNHKITTKGTELLTTLSSSTTTYDCYDISNIIITDLHLGSRETYKGPYAQAHFISGWLLDNKPCSLATSNWIDLDKGQHILYTDDSEVSSSSTWKSGGNSISDISSINKIHRFKVPSGSIEVTEDLVGSYFRWFLRWGMGFAEVTAVDTTNNYIYFIWYGNGGYEGSTANGYANQEYMLYKSHASILKRVSILFFNLKSDNHPYFRDKKVYVPKGATSFCRARTLINNAESSARIYIHDCEIVGAVNKSLPGQLTIKKCSIHDSAFRGCAGVRLKLLVDQCIFYNIPNSAVACTRGTDKIIRYCTAHDINTAGTQSFGFEMGGVHGKWEAHIHDNTIYNFWYCGIQSGGSFGETDNNSELGSAIIENNTLFFTPDFDATHSVPCDSGAIYNHLFHNPDKPTIVRYNHIYNYYGRNGNNSIYFDEGGANYIAYKNYISNNSSGVSISGSYRTDYTTSAPAKMEGYVINVNKWIIGNVMDNPMHIGVMGEPTVNLEPSCVFKDNVYLLPYSSDYSEDNSKPTITGVLIGSSHDNPVSTNPDKCDASLNSEVLSRMLYYNAVEENSDKKFVWENDTIRLVDSSYTRPTTSSILMAKSMRAGWNYGLTYVRNFGLPIPDYSFFLKIKDLGFDSIRICVSWYYHMDGDFNIDHNFLEIIHHFVVLPCKKAGLIAVINSHYDNDLIYNKTSATSSILGKTYDFSEPESIVPYYNKLWSLVSEELKYEDEYLIFEGANELVPYSGWSTASANGWTRVNAMNNELIKASRETGGNNSTRFISVCPYGARIKDLTLSFKFAECVTLDSSYDNTDRLLINFHTYSPHPFVAPGSSATNIYTESSSDIISIFPKQYTVKTYSSTVGMYAGEFGVGHAHFLDALFENYATSLDYATMADGTREANELAYLASFARICQGLNIGYMVWDNEEDTMDNSVSGYKTFGADCYGLVNLTTGEPIANYKYHIDPEWPTSKNYSKNSVPSDYAVLAIQALTANYV